MSKFEVMQKLVSISGKKKDMSKVEEELQNGWVISNMMPHEGGFLCVLEKNIELGSVLSSISTGASKSTKHIEEYVSTI